MRTIIAQSQVSADRYDSNDPWHLKRQSYTGKAPSRRAYYGEDDDNGKPTSSSQQVVFDVIFIGFVIVFILKLLSAFWG